MPDPLTLRVFRYAPERTQEYRVEARAGMTVLDALVRLTAQSR